jgi:tetratricopeptide (TPR) repeat protein
LPRALLHEHADQLPDRLRQAAEDQFAYDLTLNVLGRYSLVTVSEHSLAVHRLVQAVVREQVDEETAWAATALRLIVIGFPANPQKVATWPACERLLAHAFTITEHTERLHVNPSQTTELLCRVGTYLSNRALLLAARASFEQALRVDEAVHGREHPDTVRDLRSLGWVLRHLGDADGAKARFDEAVHLNEAIYGTENPSVADVLIEFGKLLQDLGDLSGAKEKLQRALAIYNTIYGAEHSSTLRVARSLIGL